MADQNTSIVNNDNLLMSYFERRALETLEESTYYRQLAEIYPLPKGSGQQITWQAWRAIAAASSTLAESSANSAVALSSRKVNVTIRSYGRAVKYTELLDLTSILPVQTGALERLEQCAALTVDNDVQRAIFKNVLAQVGQNADTKTKILSAWMSSLASSFAADTGTSDKSNQFGFPAVFGTSAARLSAVSKTAPSQSARLGPIGFRKAVARLRRLSVPRFADGSYAGVVHPNAWATMMGNPDWKQWHINFAGGPSESMFKHEVGKVHSVRLIESQNAPRYAVAAHSVNLCFIAGRGALGVTELDGGVKYLITKPGSQSVSDPFWQQSYVAFKVRQAAAALNPSCGVILFTHELL